jgi:hypothetical protein
MIITDGTTSLTFTGNLNEPGFSIEQTNKITNAGLLRTQVRGERFITLERIRTTGAELRSLLTLLTNGATTYYYTPDPVPEYMSSTDFPKAIRVQKMKRMKKTWNGREYYYIELTIEGIEYQ